MSKDTSTKKRWRWAVAGPGRIARSFTRALLSLEEAELTEVYSSDIERARRFSAEFGGSAEAFGSYEAIRNSRADIFYLANLNPQHYTSAKIILGAGKHLLCEKPICLNRAQAEELFDMARARGLFLMEGMWTSLQPETLQIKKWINDGRIGELGQLDLSFGFASPPSADNRIYAKKLGGSALMDLGVYGIAYAVNLFGGTPQKIQAAAHQSPEGVDLTLSMQLDFGEGKMARGVFSSEQNLTGCALISGAKGFITVPSFHAPENPSLWLYRKDAPPLQAETFPSNKDIHGFVYEAAEVMRCLDQGLTESPYHPSASCLAVMGIMDEIRRQIGLVYDEEK